MTIFSNDMNDKELVLTTYFPRTLGNLRCCPKKASEGVAHSALAARELLGVCQVLVLVVFVTRQLNV